ncbi:MAG: hypothetical protein BA066_06485, partial [Candidatus Korarchaeota archaeon NZ13-K]
MERDLSGIAIAILLPLALILSNRTRIEGLLRFISQFSISLMLLLALFILLFLYLWGYDLRRLFPARGSRAAALVRINIYDKNTNIN